MHVVSCLSLLVERMDNQWHSQEERGSARLLQIACTLALKFGRRRVLSMVWVIATYFFLTAPNARRAIVDFRRQVQGKPIGWRIVHRHFRVFAYTILDRIFWFAEHPDRCPLDIRGLDSLWPHLDTGQGCVLLGAHLGSFEAARVAAFARPNLPIRIIMEERISAHLNAVLTRLNPVLQKAIVRLGSPGALLAVKSALDQGGLVGLMGDRVADVKDAYCREFFGRPAYFPTAPLRLAAVLAAPVFFFTALYKISPVGKPYYEVLFVPLMDPPTADVSRAQWMGTLADRYVAILQKYCYEAPDNWFNFYSFWPSAENIRAHDVPTQPTCGRKSGTANNTDK